MHFQSLRKCHENTNRGNSELQGEVEKIDDTSGIFGIKLILSKAF